MQQALKEAVKAGQQGEVPIGCVIVQDDKIIGRGHNQTECKQDPTAHAELLAIRQAGRKLKSWRLEGSVLYVTVAPCAMCRAAISRARIGQLYWAAPDPKTAYGKQSEQPPAEQGEVLMAEAQQLLATFFQGLR